LAQALRLAGRRLDDDLRSSARRTADWFAGSTLQPFLERLGDDERCEFLARYRTGLKEAYPVQSDGRTLFAYPRLFIVAVKAAG
jgi:trans-aconitate 2-methyltransferase